MKTTFLIAAAITALLSGCAAPDQLAQVARTECAMLGFPSDDPRFIECVERGFRGQVQTQTQLQNDVATYLILEAFF
jgi:hypothetical protein